MAKRLKYLIEFLPVLLFDALVSALPREVALRWGEAFGHAMGRLLSRRRELVLENLRLSFPEKSSGEITRIADRIWRNIGRVTAEFVRLGELAGGNFDQLVRIENLDVLEAAKSEGKGVIAVGFHFANWEISGAGLNRAHGDAMAIARAAKNPFVQKWIDRKRLSAGVRTLMHKNAVKASLKILKERKCVGILIDQNLYTGGVFADFFGRPAATTTLPALLHTRTKSPVVLCYCLRAPGRIRLLFQKPSAMPDVQDPNFVQNFTEILSKDLESIIRQQPESWFWIHNRWKRTPEAPLE